MAEADSSNANVTGAALRAAVGGAAPADLGVVGVAVVDGQLLARPYVAPREDGDLQPRHDPDEGVRVAGVVHEGRLVAADGAVDGGVGVDGDDLDGAPGLFPDARLNLTAPPDEFALVKLDLLPRRKVCERETALPVDVALLHREPTGH